MLFGEKKVYLGDTLIVDTGGSSSGQDSSEPAYKTVDNQLYRRIFCDDFDKGDVDRNYWTTDYNASQYTPWYTGGSDVFCKDSICHIRIKEDMAVKGGTSWAAGVSGIQTAEYYYTSPKYNRARPFYGLLTQEGYYELRAKIYAGGGTHTSWWMTGVESTPNEAGEIDIFEIFGRDTSEWPANLYDDTTTVDSAQRQSVIRPGIDLANDFHVYGFLWENGLMKFYLDGTEVNTWENLNSPQYPMMTWITAYRCMSGRYPGGEHVEGLGDLELLVDYLKIYKKCDVQLTEHPTVVSQNAIDIFITAGEYTVNEISGRVAELPVYCYLNWSDGSRTEHWVRWELLNAAMKGVLDNGGTFEWLGIVYGLGVEVKATVSVNTTE